MGAGLQAHRQDVVAEAGLVGVAHVAHVDRDHGVERVDPPGDRAELRALVVEPYGQGEARAGAGGRHPSRHGGGVDQVEGAELVVVAPTPPVGDLGGELLELGRQGHCRATARRPGGSGWWSGARPCRTAG